MTRQSSHDRAQRLNVLVWASVRNFTRTARLRNRAIGRDEERLLGDRTHDAGLRLEDADGQRDCVSWPGAGMSAERVYHEFEMPKKTVRDYRSMTKDELRATAREAHQREETTRYAKGRRAWKAVWSAAEEELENRRTSTGD